MIWTVMEAVCYISFHSAENTTLMKMLILFQVLVTAGIDINIQRTITEETALHQAIVYKKVHVVKALQKYGARTDTSNWRGHMPLPTAEAVCRHDGEGNIHYRLVRGHLLQQNTSRVHNAAFEALKECPDNQKLRELEASLAKLNINQEVDGAKLREIFINAYFFTITIAYIQSSKLKSLQIKSNIMIT